MYHPITRDTTKNGVIYCPSKCPINKPRSEQNCPSNDHQGTGHSMNSGFRTSHDTIWRDTSGASERLCRVLTGRSFSTCFPVCFVADATATSNTGDIYIYKPRWLLSIRYIHKSVQPRDVIVNHYKRIWNITKHIIWTLTNPPPFVLHSHASLRRWTLLIKPPHWHLTHLSDHLALKKLTVVGKKLLKSHATGKTFTFQSDLNVINTKHLTTIFARLR